MTVAVPKSIQSIVAGYEPSYLTFRLPEDEHGGLSYSAANELKQALPQLTAAAFGPGVGQSPGLVELASEIYQHAPLPMVFDADGLNALSQRPEVVARTQEQSPRILTPHPGEFARLSGYTIAEIEAERAELATAFAKKYRVILLLKGHHTVITNGSQTFFNATGNSGMATGGTGDVLTGVIAALAYLGPRGAETLFDRWLKSRTGGDGRGGG